jgi:hypothetical protein
MRLAVRLGAVLVLSVAACTETPAPQHSEPSARLATQPPFVPRTYREGEKVVVPVTFPDGSTAEVVYPRALDLASRGVRPYTWALLDTSYGSVGRDFVIDPGRLEDVWRGDPIREYEGADGTIVPLMRDEGGDGTDYLAFGFGSWTVSVYDYPGGGARLTEEERSLWARSLTGHETEDGFLVLDARPPLRLARAGEYPSPMQLWLGGPHGGVEIWPVERCSPKQRLERSAGYASWCDPVARMYLGVQGVKEFVDAVLAGGVRVRNVVLVKSSSQDRT